MAKLTTKFRYTMARLMIDNLDPRKSAIDEFKDEILRLLPRGTEMVGLKEFSSPTGLYRDFELIFDAPFFQKDFEFDVEFRREILMDGSDSGNYHQYQMATKIINLDLTKEVKNG